MHDLAEFKATLRQQLDERGFAAAPNVLNQLESSPYFYTKSTLADLRGRISERSTQENPANFLVGLEAFIDSIKPIELSQPNDAKIRQALLGLNYHAQNRLILKFIQSQSKMGTFLAHGLEYQTSTKQEIWLLQRILTLIKNNNQTDIRELTLMSTIGCANVWNQFSKAYKLPNANPDTVIEAMSQSLKTQNIVYIIDAHNVPIIKLPTLIKSIWKPITDSSLLQQTSNYLVLFVIHDKPYSNSCPIFCDEVKAKWYCMKLPTIEAITEDILNNWIADHIHLLPQSFTRCPSFSDFEYELIHPDFFIESLFVKLKTYL